MCIMLIRIITLQKSHMSFTCEFIRVACGALPFNVTQGFSCTIYFHYAFILFFLPDHLSHSARVDVQCHDKTPLCFSYNRVLFPDPLQSNVAFDYFFFLSHNRMHQQK